MFLNITTYSPGKTIDVQPTAARQFYESLDSIPDNAIVVGHTWGHPDLVIGYYSVNNHDRFDYVNYDAVINESEENTGYVDYQVKKSINMPKVITHKEGDTIVADTTVWDFALGLQQLNPGREVYVTYVKSSEIPMEFGLVPASKYYPGINDLPPSKIQFSG
jgi:hypothetical protein